MFVLDRRRRLLFVNAAFERLTGLELEQLRGLPCRRPRPPGGDALAEDVVAHVLTPPPEVLQGTSAHVRRLYHDRTATRRAPVWWDVELLPFRQDGGHFVVGRILPVAAEYKVQLGNHIADPPTHAGFRGITRWNSPDVFAGIDPGRVAKSVVPRRRRALWTAIDKGLLPWTIVAFPTPGWATQVFGEPDVARLWDAIRATVRLDEPDPVQAWRP